jgi:hypothetical protein
MLQAHARRLIDRPAEAIFHYIAHGFFENYPRWSPEVCELELLTPGPVRLGTQARQVRIDHGRRSESTFQVAVYEPGQQIEFASLSSPYYRVRYYLEPVQEAACLHFTFELQLDFLLKPLQPVIIPVLWAESERVVNSLKRLLEAQQTQTASASVEPAFHPEPVPCF